MTDRTGQQLGNYQLIRLLGKGGFAEVYLGQHRFLSQRQVAIKILAARFNTNDGAEFQREANQLATLKHPHIVSLLDFSIEETIPYLVMDYCPGGTLRQRHPRGTRLPLPQVLSYVQQMAQALDYAHVQRVIHRDVKPENMLVGQTGEILLSDFGVATMAHSTSSMSAQAPSGTIPYMAPEQIQSQAKPASDQYALAIVAYEWLSGTCPFEGSFSEVLAKQLMTPPPPLRPRLPDLPSAVEDVLLAALAKDPRERFATVETFANALAQAADPTVPQARVRADQPLVSLDTSGSTLLAQAESPSPAQRVAPLYNTPQRFSLNTPPQSDPVWLETDSTEVAMHLPTPLSHAPQQEAIFLSPQPPNARAWAPPLTPLPQTHPAQPQRPPAQPRRGFPLALMLAGLAVLLAAGIGAAVWASGVLGGHPGPNPTPTPIGLATTAPTLAPTPTIAPTPTPSPSQLAQAVIRHYFDDINQKNYQDAYQQWGSSYQSQQTYDQFAAGFSNTVRDDISIAQVTEMPDGTVQVQMTITATEQSASGVGTKVFQGYYIVGQENGAWKLLNANFQQTS